MDEIMGDAFCAALLALLIGWLWPGYEAIALLYFAAKLSQRAERVWRSWAVTRGQRQAQAQPSRRAADDPSRIG